MNEPASDAASGYGLSRVAAAAAAEAPRVAWRPPRPRRYYPKIALVGCGGISEYHLRAYRAMGLDVACLCDRHPERAEKRRAEFFPGAETVTDWHEVMRRRDIEVVDIATAAAERPALIEEALRSGKHVLSQKPFVLDLAAGERLVRLAADQGRALAVNQNGRWAPHFSYLAAAVRAGIVGTVASVDCTLQWDHGWTQGTAFEDVHHLVLFDFGIHWFDIATRLMAGRRPERVTASVARAAGQKVRPPLLAQATIDYPDGQVRLAFNGSVRHGQEDRTVVAGVRGTLRSFGPSLSSQTVELHTAAGRSSPELEGTWFTHGFEGAMGELLCAIEEGREPAHSGRDNLESLALCFAALESADCGRPVALNGVRYPNIS